MNDTSPTEKKLYERTSVLLSRASTEITGEKIRLGILLYRLRRRSFGGLLFFLAILSLVPGISIFSGILMMILGLQLSLGFRSPLLPRKISEYNVNVNYLKSILSTAVPRIESIEQYVKPRLPVFTRAPLTLLLGVLIFSQALIVVIPLPLTNLLPALAILVIALGLLERDGLLILAGTVLSTLAISIGWIVISLTRKGLDSIL